jgi:hypothetical protein
MGWPTDPGLRTDSSAVIKRQSTATSIIHQFPQLLDEQEFFGASVARNSMGQVELAERTLNVLKNVRRHRGKYGQVSL